MTTYHRHSGATMSILDEINVTYIDLVDNDVHYVGQGQSNESVSGIYSLLSDISAEHARDVNLNYIEAF